MVVNASTFVKQTEDIIQSYIAEYLPLSMYPSILQLYL